MHDYSKINKKILDSASFISLQKGMIVIISIVLFLGAFGLTKDLNMVSKENQLEPFLFSIDENSGSPKIINSAEKQKYETDQNVTHYFLRKYLLARESYNQKTYKYQYYKYLKALSSSDVYQDYAILLYRISNTKQVPPQYLINIAKDDTVTATINSIGEISKIGEDYEVQIRFTQKTSRFNRSLNKIATIKYNFADISDNQFERIVNPLGFRVISYNIDLES